MNEKRKNNSKFKIQKSKLQFKSQKFLVLFFNFNLFASDGESAVLGGYF